MFEPLLQFLFVSPCLSACSGESACRCKENSSNVTLYNFVFWQQQTVLDGSDLQGNRRVRSGQQEAAADCSLCAAAGSVKALLLDYVLLRDRDSLFRQTREKQTYDSQRGNWLQQPLPVFNNTLLDEMIPSPVQKARGKRTQQSGELSGSS